MIWLLLILLAAGVIMLTRQDRVRRLARAIARAEGYFVGGSLPRHLNNPGALKDPVTGQLREFATASDGWIALYRQVELMLSGESNWYSPDQSIRQVAITYTGGDNPDAWARIVATELGVSPDTTLRQI